jgi:hypothetical protein
MQEDRVDFGSTDLPPGPIKEMSLFAPGEDWHQLACIGWAKGSSYPRTRGFRVAGEIIGRWVAENGDEQDGLVYPFLFCWRQHIELALKTAIEDFNVILHHPDDPPTGHNLLGLWIRYWELAKTADFRSTEGEHVAPIIRELHELDPKGDGFRYARSRTGQPHLATLGNLSLDAMGDVLERVANYFDVVTFASSAQRDLAVEIDGYF